MRKSQPLTCLHNNYPWLTQKAGPLGFIGWMHREAFSDAPPPPAEDREGGCMVLYAPKERFPEAATLGEMRTRIRSDPAAIAHADDMIVKGAQDDGVLLDREGFDPHAWAVIPDFRWPEIENETSAQTTH